MGLLYLLYIHNSPSDLGFGVVVRLAWSNDPGSCVGRSVATGWTCHAWQIRGNDPDKEGVTLVLRVGGLVAG
jgi:hypothetical protein